MAFKGHAPRVSKQLAALLLWTLFVGWALWQHAQQSQQPPIHDAATYYLKAYNFWTKVHQHRLFNPFNVEPSFRPPGTILMSYPLGFNTDYRGFYFRSVFIPIALLVLAVVSAGYRRDLDSKSKWHLVLFAAFLSSLPCYYHFEVSPVFPAPSHWGLVDNFLAGVAALATAATIRSILTRSLAWLGLAAVLSSVCLLIKPTGVLIMMLIGLTWFGVTALQLKSVWQSPDERTSATRWLLRGMVVFAVPYLFVLIGAFASHYLSRQNLAYGNGAIVIMQTELHLSWPILQSVVRMGLGYPFVAWLFLMIVLAGNYLWRTPTGSIPWPKPLLIGLVLASCITFVFGFWFWIFGSGGVAQIRYFIPFALMAAILALPAILSTVRAMPGWAIAILSMLMIAPIINMGMLLPQRDASIEWQKWTGVNLASGAADAVTVQAQNFASDIKREGRNVILYSMPMNVVDAAFQSVVDYTRIAMPPMQTVSILRPVDWQRPTTYRKDEMLDADYWLFQPVRDPAIAHAALATSSVDGIEQERVLFQAWATRLTTNEGVAVVSDTPTARVLRIANSMLLELAFDELVAKHQWRSVFMAANPKRRFNEKELAAALAQNPLSLENINFGDRFHLRALSVSRTGEDTTVRVWWRPLSPLPEKDWAFFIHSIDNQGKIMGDHYIPIRFNGTPSPLDRTALFSQVVFRNPTGNGSHRLAIGFVRPNQALPIADKGTRDWNNSRVIVPLP